MHLLVKTAPLLAALAATASLAVAPDPKTDRHPPPAAAKPDAKAQMQGCPMMSGKMAMNTDGKAAPKAVPKGKAGAPGSMMKGGDMPCMPVAQAKPEKAQPPVAGEDHSHEHPAK